MKYLLSTNLRFYQSSAHCTKRKKQKKRKRLEQYNSNNKLIHGHYICRYNLHHTHTHHHHLHHHHHPPHLHPTPHRWVFKAVLMQWLTECVLFQEAENSRQKEWHGKMSDVQMFWSLCAECVEFLSQRRRGAVLMDSRHGEDHTDKQETVSEKKE